jgi:phosphodiesterase/alkaline phosphatase D-like protein
MGGAGYTKITVTPTGTGATITWNTYEPATTQVKYGITSGYGSTSSLNPSLVTSHSVTLTGLLPATLYHYQVISVDAVENVAALTDQTLTTAP